MADVDEEVREALAGGKAVVGLESTIIAHGLPRPRNLEVARQLEADVRAAGAVPATIAVLDGSARVGLDDAGLQRVAGGELAKLSVRDLPLAATRGADGATTVAATAHLAARAGIRVCATGGLGGVHRGARDSWDESADLMTLVRTPITLVAAGVKSILDIGATLERLETLGVAVAGWRTNRFPGFYVTDGGFDLDWRVDDADEVARAMAAADELGVSCALLVANPVGVDQQLDPDEHERVLSEALAQARAGDVTGKAVTPFVLDHLHAATEGRSLEVNVAIARANARVAGEIAVAWAAAR
ncbi:MAG TPA: pseudouridine-5'-phosphate glycosidase [Solirubrobacteraceae bacterium]